MEVAIIKPQELEINQQIRDREVRVIDPLGKQLGVMSSRQAYFMARDVDLDLVKISPNANPPVCKIMDYGKYRFEQSKKLREAKKNQRVIEVKEIQLSTTIDTGDLNTKAKKAAEILTDGNKVRVTIRMRGRQQLHPEFGQEVMSTFAEMLAAESVVEKPPKIEGRNIWMVLAPKK